MAIVSQESSSEWLIRLCNFTCAKVIGSVAGSDNIFVVQDGSMIRPF
jgi:hypothetical protein